MRVLISWGCDGERGNFWQTTGAESSVWTHLLKSWLAFEVIESWLILLTSAFIANPGEGKPKYYIARKIFLHSGIENKSKF